MNQAHTEKIVEGKGRKGGLFWVHFGALFEAIIRKEGKNFVFYYIRV